MESYVHVKVNDNCSDIFMMHFIKNLLNMFDSCVPSPRVKYMSIVILRSPLWVEMTYDSHENSVTNNTFYSLSNF